MRRVRCALAGVVLLGLIAVAYQPVWNNEFVDFDDEPYITGNPHVAEGPTCSGIWWAWTNDEAPYWTPLTWLSLQCDACFFSTRGPLGETVLSPAAFHGQNLLWHAAGVLLLFRLWRRLSGAVWPSFLIAALFAVHPMHVESVAWAIERKDVLSVFFGILTLYAYVHCLERPGWKRYLPLAAAYLLSLLSKPMLITLPVVLLLLDFWPLRRWGPIYSGTETAAGRLGTRIPFGGLVLEKLPLFVLAGTIALVTQLARDRHGSMTSFDDIPLIDRLANALTAYGWYVSSTFCPSRLAALYPHPRDNWSLPGALAGAACLASLTVLALCQARRRPWLFVGWLWFVIALAPVIGFAQGGAQAWADRFSYWPHVGLFAAVVWEFEPFAGPFRLPSWILRAAWVIVLVGLTGTTRVQVGYWHDSVALWEHTLAVTKENDRAEEHMSISYRKRGRIEEADRHTAEALRIQAQRLYRSSR